jgi:benzoyl-CoA reductase/2-hydroxyglutaryl-CoA dehydratase subunit BcrC/BadD/HgdB
VYTNRCEDYKAEFLLSQFREFGVDAVIYHDGRTAPDHSNVRYGLESRLRRTTGLPSLVLEADSHDLRLFSMEQVLGRLEDFLEAQEETAAVPDRRGLPRGPRGSAEGVV